MEITVLDGARIKEMLVSGALLLEQHKDQVDALNVFPVPDGDTGTNMSLTITAAVNEINRLNSKELGTIIEAASRGSLMGARGNSGVILSQLIRGIAKELRHLNRIGTEVFAQALEQGYKTASEAVMKPMEGTILTVAREAAKAATKAAQKSASFDYLFEKILAKASETLEETPNMLPVLKQAGVVDAGAKGWVLILEGMYNGLSGLDGARTNFQNRLPLTGEYRSRDSATIIDQVENDIEFAYCTELLLLNPKKSPIEIRENLEDLGDSLLVVGESEAVKVHIHSNHPGQVLERCLTFGSLDNIKIENMIRQNEAQKAGQSLEATIAAATPITTEIAELHERKPYGFLAVSTGEGLEKLFTSLGVDVVLSGGQTNNPSTEDLVKAIEKIDAELVYVLPNNGNVVMTARQAADIVQGREVEVVPTKSLPAGIAALIAFQPDKDRDFNVTKMLKATGSIKAAEITYAVRDTVVDGQDIKKDDIIGIVDDKILAVGTDMVEVAVNLINSIVDEESEIVSIYSGQDVSGDTLERLTEILEEKYPNLEVEGHYGGQPLYYFLVSVE